MNIKYQRPMLNYILYFYGKSSLSKRIPPQNEDIKFHSAAGFFFD